MSNWTDGLAAFYSLIACIAAVILLTLLHRRQRRRRRRRLTALEAQLKSLNRDVRRLETAHESLLVRFMNLPRPLREEPSKSSKPALELVGGTATIQPDQQGSDVSAH
jgi:Flp pilus assembly protein TadB